MSELMRLAADAERLTTAIRVMYPHSADAAIVEARRRGWSLDRLYHELACGWLPPEVD
jgi:hypothetical protein